MDKQDIRSEKLRLRLEQLREDVNRELEDETLSERTRQITAGLPLVAETACRYLHTGVTLDDLIQIGTVGLIKALDDGADDQEEQVVAYIEAELQDYCDRNGWKQEPPCEESGSDEDHLEEKMKRLTEPEQKILVMRFGLRGEESRTAAEVAELLGLSLQEVSELQRTALRKMNGTCGFKRKNRVLKLFEE